MEEIKLFNNEEIRSYYDENKEEYYFSVIDVIKVLTEKDYDISRKYRNKLKQRLANEGSQLVSFCHQLKLKENDLYKNLIIRSRLFINNIKCCFCANKYIKCKHKYNIMKTINYENKINELVKNNNGILFPEVLKDNNIPSIYLTRMEKKGILNRIDRGIYISSFGDYDEYYFLFKTNKKIIYSYFSALYLLKFSDVIPLNKEITLYKGYNSHRLNKEIKIHYVNKDIYDLGVIEIETIFGNKVKTYDIERTLCDFIKNRNKIDSETFNKTINRYSKYENKDLNKLYEYSKKMKIYNKVKEIMEILCE